MPTGSTPGQGFGANSGPLSNLTRNPLSADRWPGSCRTGRRIDGWNAAPGHSGHPGGALKHDRRGRRSGLARGAWGRAAKGTVCGRLTLKSSSGTRQSARTLRVAFRRGPAHRRACLHPDGGTSSTPAPFLVSPFASEMKGLAACRRPSFPPRRHGKKPLCNRGVHAVSPESSPTYPRRQRALAAIINDQNREELDNRGRNRLPICWWSLVPFEPHSLSGHNNAFAVSALAKNWFVHRFNDLPSPLTFRKERLFSLWTIRRPNCVLSATRADRPWGSSTSGR